MKTINEDTIETEIEIKKSKFIAKLFYVRSVQEVTDILKTLSKTYATATHICFAYVFENAVRAFDDGEPSGTAGKPILNVLQQKGLTNILAVVIRYFGGIKLGAGGLTRAYCEATSKVVNLASIVEIKEMVEIKFHISYEQAFNIYVLTNYSYFEIAKRVGNDFVIRTTPELFETALNSIKQFNVSNIEIKNIKV